MANGKQLSITLALLTGVFCSVFAVVIDAIMDMAGPLQVAILAALSGFLGSLFGQTVLKKKR